MEITTVLILLMTAGVLGIGFGYFLRLIISLGKRGSMELEIKQMILSAREEAVKIIEEAEAKAAEIENTIKRQQEEKEAAFKKTEDRLIRKESLLDTRQSDIDHQTETLKEKEAELADERKAAEELRGKRQEELARISLLSEEEARKELIAELEKQYEEDLLIRARKLESTATERLDRQAKDLLATAVQRLANSTASELTTSSVPISSDDVKGKIIGKEGRNIRAFEHAAGVDLIIDDTPGSITISSFDPVRRHVAKVALERLIDDGRIQPARIEEVVTAVREEVQKTIRKKGEEAAYECGLYNLDPHVLSILGRLHFRTSFGQNVLQHSIEMAHLASMLAEELGGDVSVAKTGALLHDIGKAVDHEVQGTHVEIGRRILQKFGVDEQIIQAMQSHHEEYPYETLESIIVQTADAISGGRPGARSDKVENYLKRLGDLERLTSSFPGVERTYALEAGREIRVFVRPNEVSDMEAKRLAREIARKIESELKYPGEIRVHIIRESRVIDYAR